MPDWDPKRYERFAAERRRPFVDLVAMCQAVSGGVIYDLGCGTGARTAELPDALGAATVIGIDTSTSMLERTVDIDDERVTFRTEDLRSFDPDPPPDILLSNAALHWVTNHAEVLASWRTALSPGGQLAVQIPANFDHPTQTLITAIAHDHLDWFENREPPKLISANGLAPEQYAEILHDLGATKQQVVLRVYDHVLPRTLDVVEWLKGTTLRPYRTALTPERYESFVDEFSHRLVAQYGDRDGFLYTFKRILFWARF